ncbi:MAG: hypothetical protein DDT19_00078 [Syntrophomonadaceae bacterium]|nr:hypothetical protein [Bacillota bacterium]
MFLMQYALAGHVTTHTIVAIGGVTVVGELLLSVLPIIALVALIKNLNLCTFYE